MPRLARHVAGGQAEYNSPQAASLPTGCEYVNPGGLLENEYMTRREMLAMAGTAAAWLPAGFAQQGRPAGGGSGGFQRTPGGRRADLGVHPPWWSIATR